MPAGSHWLVFRYRPLSFRLGLIVSAAGLLALGLFAIWSFKGQPERSGD